MAVACTRGATAVDTKVSTNTIIRMVLESSLGPMAGNMTATGSMGNRMDTEYTGTSEVKFTTAIGVMGK